MNLPEYRAELERATRQFHDKVSKAAEEYEVTVSAASNLFFNEQDVPVKLEAATERVESSPGPPRGRGEW